MARKLRDLKEKQRLPQPELELDLVDLEGMVWFVEWRVRISL